MTNTQIVPGDALELVSRRSLLALIAATAGSLVVGSAEAEVPIGSPGVLLLDVPAGSHSLDFEGPGTYEFWVPTRNGGESGIAVSSVTVTHLGGTPELKKEVQYLPNNLHRGEAYPLHFTWSPTRRSSVRARIDIEYGLSGDERSERRMRVEREYGKPLAKLKTRRDQLVQLGADTSAVDRREAQDREAWARTSSGLDATIAEREKELEDLLAGDFCSTCSRSRTEIERSGSETFDEHIKAGASSGRHRIQASKTILDAAQEKIDAAKLARVKQTAAFAARIERHRLDREQLTRAHEERIHDLERKIEAATLELGNAWKAERAMEVLLKGANFMLEARCKA
jgi:hypothetical protein